MVVVVVDVAVVAVVLVAVEGEEENTSPVWLACVMGGVLDIVVCYVCLFRLSICYC